MKKLPTNVDFHEFKTTSGKSYTGIYDRDTGTMWADLDEAATASGINIKELYLYLHNHNIKTFDMCGLFYKDKPKNLTYEKAINNTLVLQSGKSPTNKHDNNIFQQR